jgi:DNA modification methylase
MGSGSTLIAAEAEGFSAIGIDSDPESVATARRRWANKLAETPLFSQDLTPCEST